MLDRLLGFRLGVSDWAPQICFWATLGGTLLIGPILPAQAQLEDPLGLPNTSVSGSVGFMGGLYGASGISSRRPTARSEISANLSFKILGVESGLNLLYSTESTGLRQSMNRLGFSWSWDWGQVEAGTVSPSYSEYSLNGASLRGGAIKLTPGPVDLAFSAGRAQRAAAPSSKEGFRQSAFEQWLYAARLGVGRKERSHFHLVGTLARDVRSSLRQVRGARPAENLTLTPDVGIALFDGRVRLQTEATVSAFTRDTRTQELDLGVSVPEILFTPRVGSRLDYAGTSRLQLDLDVFQFDASYERVQPGFRSLGLSRIRSDQEVIRLNPRVQVLGGDLSVGLDLKRVRNNLLGQRAAQQRQRQIGANVQARLSRGLTVSGSYMWLANEQEPTSSAALGQSLQRRLVTRTATLSPSITFRSGSVTHSLSLSGNYQRLDNQPGFQAGGSSGRPGRGGASTNLSTTTSYSLSFPSGLSLSLSGNYLRNDARGATTTAYGASASAGYGFFGRTLRLNLTGGWSENRTQAARGGDRQARQLRFGGTAAYRLPFGDTIRLKGRLLSNQSVQGRGQSFEEGQLTLRYSHQF